jgi:uncharacterized membrane protein YphA (DoxX/SURF4 family)
LNYLGFACRWTLALVLITASLGKVRGFSAFLDTVREIGFDAGLARAGALLIIISEATFAILLATGLWPWVAIGGAGCLLGLFVATSIWKRQSEIQCRCFGGPGSTIGVSTLSRSLMLVAILVGYLISWRSTSSIWWPSSLPTVIPMGGVVLGGVLAVAWSTYLADLLLERRTAS